MTTNQHVRGYPYSASTYKNKGCRCTGCRNAHAAKMRLYRAYGTAAEPNYDPRTQP